MTSLQVGLIVVLATTAVFVLAASILGALERAPGLRGTVAIPDSPSRALAVPLVVGGLALVVACIALPPASHQRGFLILGAGGGAGLVTFAASAFVRAASARRRVGRFGQGLLLLSLVIATYFLGRP